MQFGILGRRYMNRLTISTVAGALLFLLPGITPQPGASQTSPPGAQTAPASQTPATLTDFAWLAGRWQGDWGPRIAEQEWMAPRAGLMVGTFRLVEDDKTLVIELFTLLQRPDGIEFRFRHFTPDLVTWEKSDATVLALESLDPKKIVFVNPVNGQPKHAILTRIDPDTYVSRSEIVPETGDLQVIEITYHRQGQAPSATNPKSHPAKH
jgi:hypothetical protein